MSAPHILTPRCWLLSLSVVVDLGREVAPRVWRWVLQDRTSACRWEEK